MAPLEQARFLAVLGHWLTVVARSTYKFQSEDVTDPRTLRSLNEIHHRIYAQINGLVTRRSAKFAPVAMASCLAAEGESEQLQKSCLWAFEEAHKRYKAKI